MKKIIQIILLVLVVTACGKTGPKTTDTTPPQTPNWSSIIPGNKEVHLAWKANTDSDLSHYLLYWGTESGQLNDTLELEKTATSHTLTSLSNGTPYFFALSAVDTNDNASAKSIEVQAIPEALQKPPAPPPPVEGDFSISTLEALSIQQGQGKALSFSLARNNFTDEITLTLKNAPEGVTSDLPLSTTGDQVVATLNVANGETVVAGEYELEFEASSGDLSKILEITLIVTEPPAPPPVPEVQKPEITSVSLEGFFTSNQVRQGHEGFVLAITGTNLANVINLSFSDTVDWEILENSNTLVRVKASLPHGTSNKGIHLSLSTSAGSDSVENALIVSSIVAAPNGNDLTGKGTHDLPFRSLTKAVSVANSQDKILLKEGQYSAASGEDFPINVSGLTIEGKGSFETVLVGTDSINSCLIVTSSEADTSLSRFGVEGCDKDGILLEAGNTYLSQIKLIENKTNGLTLTDSAEAIISQSQFSLNAVHGILAMNNSKIKLEGDLASSFANNDHSGVLLVHNSSLIGHKMINANNHKHGLWISGGGVTVSLQDSSFAENGDAGIFIENSQKVALRNINVLNSSGHGIYVTGNTELTLETFQSNANHGDGINVNVTANETAILDLRDTNIKGNDESGIEYRSQNTASKLSVAESTIEDNATYGLYIAGKSTAISLGFLKPAANMFRNNGTLSLVDARDSNSGPITAYGTNFADGIVLFSDATGLKNGPASILPYWQITNPGNSIDFGAAE